TIPIALLARLVRTNGSTPPLDTVSLLRHRAMVLVYLSLDTDRFTEFDAHYFPEAAIHITRLSEPKNYSLTTRHGRTVLCAELPCDNADPDWAMNDDHLRALVWRERDLPGLGPLPNVRQVHVRRLSHAYPLYTRGYRQAFDEV